jgi:hypothetical protein
VHCTDVTVSDTVTDSAKVLLVPLIAAVIVAF